MNIFVLSESPSEAAQYHCDRHVLKMIIEYAQLLATAHRILDGTEKRVTYLTKAGTKRTKKVWVHPDPEFDAGLYAATHVNHPCAVWARDCDSNYAWLRSCWASLVREYGKRYSKSHKTWITQQNFLMHRPMNIRCTEMRTPFPLAMPDEYKTMDPVDSYRRYYLGDKSRFAKWAHSPVPDWYGRGLMEMALQ